MKKDTNSEIAQKTLIDTILSERSNKTKNQKATQELPELFTSSEFFLENSPYGLMKKETFQLLLDNFSASDFQELSIFLEKLNRNEYIEFNSIAYGKGLIKKMYANTNGPRGREKFTIPAVDNVPRFLVNYIMLRFKCSFSLQELYDLVKQ